MAPSTPSLVELHLKYDGPIPAHERLAALVGSIDKVQELRSQATQRQVKNLMSFVISAIRPALDAGQIDTSRLTTHRALGHLRDYGRYRTIAAGRPITSGDASWRR